MIYTTNAIESLHRGLRKIIKTRGAFPSDEAAMKSFDSALRNLGVHLETRHRVASRICAVHYTRVPLADYYPMTINPPWERSHTLYRTLSGRQVLLRPVALYRLRTTRPSGPVVVPQGPAELGNASGAPKAEILSVNFMYSKRPGRIVKDSRAGAVVVFARPLEQGSTPRPPVQPRHILYEEAWSLGAELRPKRTKWYSLAASSHNRG